LGTRVLLHVCRAGERGGFFFKKDSRPLKKTRDLSRASHMEWWPSCCTRAWVVRGFVLGSHSDILAGLSFANHRAPAHSLKRSRTRVRECVVRACGEEGSSLRGRGKLRGLRGGGGLDVDCNALAPTACGLSLACGRLVVGTGSRSQEGNALVYGGPHTPERANGQHRERKAAVVLTLMRWPPVRHLYSRVSRRPEGTGPRSVEAHKPAVCVPSS